MGLSVWVWEMVERVEEKYGRLFETHLMDERNRFTFVVHEEDHFLSSKYVLLIVMLSSIPQRLVQFHSKERVLAPPPMNFGAVFLCL